MVNDFTDRTRPGRLIADMMHFAIPAEAMERECFLAGLEAMTGQQLLESIERARWDNFVLSGHLFPI